MIEYFCLGLKIGAAITGGLVFLTCWASLAALIGWLVGTLMSLAEGDDDGDGGASQ